MSDYGKTVLITNCFTHLCHAVCIFLISDRKDGAFRSALRMSFYWIICIGLRLIAVSFRLDKMYWFITNFTMLLLLAVFSLDSSGIFRKKLFMFSLYSVYFYVTMIPCELSLNYLPPPYCYILYTPIRVTMYALLMVFWLKKGKTSFEKATDKISPGHWGILCVFSVSAIV